MALRQCVARTHEIMSHDWCKMLNAMRQVTHSVCAHDTELPCDMINALKAQEGLYLQDYCNTLPQHTELCVCLYLQDHLIILCNILLRHTIATHYSNTLQQHTTATHYSNTLQQHTTATHWAVCLSLPAKPSHHPLACQPSSRTVLLPVASLQISAVCIYQHT